MNVRLLKAKRTERDIAQWQVAKALNITQKTYSFKERGLLEFRRDEIEALQDILELKPEEVHAIFFAKTVTDM